MDPRFNSSPFTKLVPVSAFSPPPEASHIHSQPSTLLWPDPHKPRPLWTALQNTLKLIFPTGTKLQAPSP